MPHASSSSMSLRPNPLAGTPYAATRRLGGGATSEVYEARHVALDKLVIVKLLREEHLGDARLLDRMRFEAQALARLCHPNLTAVTDFGETAAGLPYFVMERHEGRSLADELRARGHLPVAEAVALAQQLLAGLEAAHAIGIIHRDVKLENLFLCSDGRLKILDFGIAKLLPGASSKGAPAPLALRTEEGVTLGTPRFLSPEQVLCCPVDRRTDVYGAGMVVFELIAGKDPFHDESSFVGLLQAHLSRPVPPLSTLASQAVEPALEDVVHRALSKDPAARYATAAELSAALVHALHMRAAPPPPAPGTLEPGPAFALGDVFHGYTVQKKLGEGLHGEVFQVEHVHTSERFALKVLRLEDARDASKVQRALRTAKASYKIKHANVVTVHDLGCEDDGRVWVLMELLEGESIAELLARLGGRLSVPVALHIAIEAAWGIDAAHEHSILHRDIKPDNVWLTREGVVKVLDFSLALVIPDGVRTTQRQGGFALGTAPFMAPETLRGTDQDARVDVYALGMMLYMMLAGHPFHDAYRDTNEMVRRQLFVEPAPVSAAAGLPAYVDDVMRRAIAKDRAGRFFTIAAMAQAMTALRDRLHADAHAGRIAIEPVEGEPPLPGPPWARRAYLALQDLPLPDLPPAVPSQRVKVTGPKGTVVEAGRPAQPGPGGTIPFGSDDFANARRELAQPAPSSAPQPPDAPRAEGGPAGPASGEETVVSHRKRFGLTHALVLALTVTAIALFAVYRLAGAPRAARAAAASTSAAPATASATALPPPAETLATAPEPAAPPPEPTPLPTAIARPHAPEPTGKPAPSRSSAPPGEPATRNLYDDVTAAPVTATALATASPAVTAAPSTTASHRVFGVEN